MDATSEVSAKKGHGLDKGFLVAIYTQDGRDVIEKVTTKKEPLGGAEEAGLATARVTKEGANGRFPCKEELHKEQ